jgi:membrane-bound serine protease (ClpP class)
MTGRGFALAVAASLAALFALVLPMTAVSQGANSPVTVIELDGAIDKVSARFLDRALAEAEDEKAGVAIIRVDTPGGLLDATRDMVGDIFGSRVPVVSYVAPEGAQAASAGTFVATSAALVAMAPATNIGAAAVVGAGGEDLPETLSKKATEDAAALIRSIADRRGRPIRPFEATVREAPIPT